MRAPISPSLYDSSRQRSASWNWLALERQVANPDAALAALAKARERSRSVEDALGATEAATVGNCKS
ncbi:MAG: hypothetical protein QM784_13410 [Polyangiaceae bacterium]